MAIGENAQAGEVKYKDDDTNKEDPIFEGENSVALGQGSYIMKIMLFLLETTESSAFTRRIVNVADAINANDAVNLGQLEKKLENSPFEIKFFDKSKTSAEELVKGANGKFYNPTELKN